MPARWPVARYPPFTCPASVHSAGASVVLPRRLLRNHPSRGAAARAEEALWEAFVRAITTERCPALQEVIVPSLHWPTSP